MAALMVTCPITGRSISTGVEVEAEQFRQLPDVRSVAHCPHCGTAHEWSVKEAWLPDEPGNPRGPLLRGRHSCLVGLNFRGVLRTALDSPGRGSQIPGYVCCVA